MSEHTIKQKFNHYKSFTEKSFNELESYYTWKFKSNPDATQYKDYILFNQLQVLYKNMIDNYIELDKCKQDKILNAIDEKNKAITELHNLLQIIFVNNGSAEFLNIVNILKDPAKIESINAVFSAYQKLRSERNFQF
ncbi:MAG: hypothetical protein ACOYO1_18865 [Bacteroidales bacterium]